VSTAARWFPWVGLVVALAAGVWLTHRLNVATRASAELAAAHEREGLEAQNFTVELQVRAEAAEREAAKVPGLQAALERAMKAAPGGKVTEVVKGHVEIVAGGEARPGPAGAPCLVAQGDRIDLRYAGGTVRYEAGSRVPVIYGEMWRTAPKPDTLLGSGELVIDEALFVAQAAAATPGPGWGFGAALFGSPTGLAYGLALSPPPVRLGRASFELTVAVGWGQTGAHGTATVIGRLP
jgi:hypothetical protein